MDLPSQDPKSRPALSRSLELSGNPSNGRRPFQAIIHLAVLTGFIFPITLLPYLLSRRRLSSLQTQVDSMGASIRILQQDMSRASSELTTHMEETHGRMRALRQETDELRLRSKHRTVEQLASDEAIRRELRILLDERQRSRLVQYPIDTENTIQTIGTSHAVHILLHSALLGLP